MRKITLNDFSGGINEGLSPEDFSKGQWSRLIGFIPAEDGSMESAWPIQTLGNPTFTPTAIHAMTSSSGTYVVALDSAGILHWCKSLDRSSSQQDFVTVNNLSWSVIPGCQNVDKSGDPIGIAPNEDYKFLCDIPLQIYKYVVDVDETTPENISLDEPQEVSLGVATGVLINSTTVNGDPDIQSQVLVAYIDDANNDVKVISFPNVRRVPMHDEDEGSIIKVYIGNDTYVTFDDWFAENTTPPSGANVLTATYSEIDGVMADLNYPLFKHTDYLNPDPNERFDAAYPLGLYTLRPFEGEPQNVFYNIVSTYEPTYRPTSFFATVLLQVAKGSNAETFNVDYDALHDLTNPTKLYRSMFSNYNPNAEHTIQTGDFTGNLHFYDVNVDSSPDPSVGSDGDWAVGVYTLTPEVTVEIDTVASSGTTRTYTTKTPHGYSTGDRIHITGLGFEDGDDYEFFKYENPNNNISYIFDTTFYFNTDIPGPAYGELIDGEFGGGSILDYATFRRLYVLYESGSIVTNQFYPVNYPGIPTEFSEIFEQPNQPFAFNEERGWDFDPRLTERPNSFANVLYNSLEVWHKRYNTITYAQTFAPYISFKTITVVDAYTFTTDASEGYKLPLDYEYVVRDDLDNAESLFNAEKAISHINSLPVSIDEMPVSHGVAYKAAGFSSPANFSPNFAIKEANGKFFNNVHPGHPENLSNPSAPTRTPTTPFEEQNGFIDLHPCRADATLFGSIEDGGWGWGGDTNRVLYSTSTVPTRNLSDHVTPIVGGGAGYMMYNDFTYVDDFSFDNPANHLWVKVNGTWEKFRDVFSNKLVYPSTVSPYLSTANEQTWTGFDFGDTTPPGNLDIALILPEQAYNHSRVMHTAYSETSDPEPTEDVVTFQARVPGPLNEAYLVFTFQGPDVYEYEEQEGEPEPVAPELYRSMHPYTYLDENAALLPGRGIIPRANVGTVKNNLLLVGDIEWRSDLSQEIPTPQDQYLTTASGEQELTVREYQLVWPEAPFPDFARVIYNEGPGTLYVKETNSVVSDIISYSIGGGVLTFSTQSSHGYVAGDTVEISGMNDVVNGTYTVLSSPAPTTYLFSVAKVYTGRDVIKRSSTGTTRLLETASAHGLIAGQYIVVTGVNSDYNAAAKVLSVPNSVTFTYTFSGAASVSETNVTVSPAGRVALPPTPIRTIYGDGEYLTVELGDPNGTDLYTHGYVPGRFVYLNNLAVGSLNIISGSPTSINGIYEIVDVPSTTSFKVRSVYRTAITITNRDYDEATDTATIDTGQILDSNFIDGETIIVSGLGSNEFNGTFEIEALVAIAPSSDNTAFTYVAEFDKTYASKAVNRPNALAQTTFKVSAGTAIAPVGRGVSYEYKMLPGAYQTIPDSWDDIYVSASEPLTKVKAVKNLNAAYAILNDGNTGPHRGAIYFSTGGDIDTFDPRAVLQVGKSDVTISGMHVLNDNVIVITTAGGPNDGVYRISGYLSRLIQYGSSNDPNAVRMQLLRGGIGAPPRQSTKHRSYSTVWSDAGVVVFLDHLGGVWYTNGSTVDRLDRVGPLTPPKASEDDHVEALGRHLFLYRNGRWYCLTMLDSDGSTGRAAWTQLRIPRTTISSMTASGEQLFFISDGSIFRMTKLAPPSEYGAVDGVYYRQRICTPPIGDTSSHERVNWHRVGVTLTALEHENIDVDNIPIRYVEVREFYIFSNSLRDLESVNPETMPDVHRDTQYHVETYKVFFSDSQPPLEIIVPAGIGPQPMCSADISFFGPMRLNSVSFWVTGGHTYIGGDQV